MRFRHLGALGITLACTLSGCASSQPTVRPATAAEQPTPTSAPAKPGLLFQVEPVQAEVMIDGKSLGHVSDLVAAGGLVPLDPGLYQVSLRCPGFVTWRAEVAVRSGEAEPIRVTLNKR